MLGRIAKTGVFLALPFRLKLAWIGTEFIRGKRARAGIYSGLALGQAFMGRRRSAGTRTRQARGSGGVMRSVTRAAGRAAGSAAVQSVRSMVGQRSGSSGSPLKISRQRSQRSA